MYKVGPRYLNYKEETLFLKMEEFRFQETISLDVSFNQKLGQVSGSTSFGHYDISTDDLLTRRRQFDSNYAFYTSFGIRYRFGSLFNNVVNPRFDGGGGGGGFFFN